MVKFRAVGFDLDGTLFDHVGCALAGLDDFLLSLGVEPSDSLRAAWFRAETEQYERWRVGDISHEEQRRERLRVLLPIFGLEVPGEPHELDAVFAGYLRGYRAAWRAYPDSACLLRDLRAAGYRLGVLTNGTEPQQRAKLSDTGLIDGLDTVCTAERIGVQKPAPLAFRTLADELGVAPSECLFVGDSAEHDVAGAQAVGMSALLVDRFGAHAEGIAAAVQDALAAGPRPESTP